jgi:signal transduction histidine kinase
LAEQKKVALDFRILDSAPASLVLDVDIIRDEVLGNLLSNALKFTPPGERIELTVHGEEGGVVFTVTDSGPGIPPEHRDFIFEKHYRGDRSNAVGSGLGLAIAKEMVELHGGLITLEESEEGQGARFRVALPLTPPSPELEVPHASLALAGRLRPRKQRARFPVASA